MYRVKLVKVSTYEAVEKTLNEEQTREKLAIMLGGLVEAYEALARVHSKGFARFEILSPMLESFKLEIALLKECG